ncbi:MAG: multicopper oxidase domain-containing protein [Deltaproteobacteria bacterium]|nr:multicopper oxidase domain-containing protein [Deltaproteobacteria bacterium]
MARNGNGQGKNVLMQKERPDSIPPQINGVTVAEPIWRDPVNVRGHSTVTVRSRFDDFTGLLVLHCHIFNHEDIGMMQTLEIYKAPL